MEIELLPRNLPPVMSVHICPPMMRAGQQIMIKTPAGQLMAVVIPDGVQPGMSFQVPVPAWCMVPALNDGQSRMNSARKCSDVDTRRLLRYFAVFCVLLTLLVVIACIAIAIQAAVSSHSTATAPDACTCAAPLVCSRGLCLTRASQALLAFKDSGNGNGLETWVPGTDPCGGPHGKTSTKWAGVCCGAGGWEYGNPILASQAHENEVGPMYDDRPSGSFNIPTCHDDPRISHQPCGSITGLHLAQSHQNCYGKSEVMWGGSEAIPSALTGEIIVLGPLGGTLITLDLPCTRASGHVADLAAFAGLTHLGTSGPGFAGDVGGLAPLTRLTYVDLTQSASITGNVAVFGRHLSELVTLLLSGSGVTGDVADIHGCVFSTCVLSLSYLNLYGTAVTGDGSWPWMAGLGYIKSLVGLRIGNFNPQDNLITGDVGGLGGLTDLTYLAIVNVLLVTGDVSGISSLTSLDHLDLRNTPLTGWPLTLAQPRQCRFIESQRTCCTSGHVAQNCASTPMTIRAPVSHDEYMTQNRFDYTGELMSCCGPCVAGQGLNSLCGGTWNG